MVGVALVCVVRGVGWTGRALAQRIGVATVLRYARPDHAYHHIPSRYYNRGTGATHTSGESLQSDKRWGCDTLIHDIHSDI
jgi:hypothetical protein